MCNIGYHNCPECGDEIKCDLKDSECGALQYYDFTCVSCERWVDEQRREMEADERRKEDAERWLAEHGFEE